MLEINNPYQPGAGRKPLEISGRESEIGRWKVIKHRITSGLDARPLCMYGLRGVGKTVLLQHMHNDARKSGWISAHVESYNSKDLRSLLVDALENPLANLAAPKASETVRKALKTMLNFLPKATFDSLGGWSFGIDLSTVVGSNTNTPSFEGDLYRLVRDLCDAALEKKVGLSFFIDEAGDLSEHDLAAICAVQHKASQENLPFVVVLAGLPTLPSILSKAKSYAERQFEYIVIGKLSARATSRALIVPSRRQDVEWEDDALVEMMNITDGYPYFIQEFGSAVWTMASQSPIKRDDVASAIPLATKNLDQGFFRSRWDRATNAQKEYLKAMAEDLGEPSSTSDIANRLNTDVTSLGPRRAELISKGLIYANEHGKVAFTVPRMSDFIERQSEI
jgi:hypothetical protein